MCALVLTPTVPVQLGLPNALLVDSITSVSDIIFGSDSDASSAGDLVFKTSGVERARITTAGPYKTGGSPEIDHGGGNLATPQFLSLKEGSVASPVTTEKYTTPAIYIERHTNSVVPTGYVFWGNAKKTAPLVVEVVGYGSETGEVNGIATRVRSTGPTVAGSGNVALSTQAETNSAGGVQNRDCWGANFSAQVFGSGIAPSNLVGIEVDIGSTVAPVTTGRPGVGTNSRFIAYWAQSTGQPGTAGVWVTSFNGSANNADPGWQFGIIAEAHFLQWAGYFANTKNATGVGGLFVSTVWGASTSHILEVAGAAGTMLLVDGDGNNPVSIRLNNALVRLQQQNTTGTTTGFTAGVGTGVKDDSTFTGGTGSTAYRISDIVKALKNLGFLSA